MTFSLLGLCPHTGMLGGVVATSSPAVGSRCLFTRATIGAVLTQHWTDPRLGPRALDLLEGGLSAPAAADAALHETPDRDWRQLAVLDTAGRTAHRSGARVKHPHAGATGPGCVAIGNILATSAVPAAMVNAFAAPGPLAERLLRALQAGLDAGGEGRPLVSAALQVAYQAPFPYIDLRIDADEDPVPALHRTWLAFAPHADTITARALHPRTMPQSSLDPAPTA